MAALLLQGHSWHSRSWNVLAHHECITHMCGWRRRGVRGGVRRREGGDILLRTFPSVDIKGNHKRSKWKRKVTSSRSRSSETKTPSSPTHNTQTGLSVYIHTLHCGSMIRCKWRLRTVLLWQLYMFVGTKYNSEDTCKTMLLHVRRLNSSLHTHPSTYNVYKNQFPNSYSPVAFYILQNVWEQCYCMSKRLNASFTECQEKETGLQVYMCGDSRGCPTSSGDKQAIRVTHSVHAELWTSGPQLHGNMYNTTCNLDDNWSVKSWNGNGSLHWMATMCSTNLNHTMHTHVHKYALKLITKQLLNNKVTKTNTLHHIMMI